VIEVAVMAQPLAAIADSEGQAERIVPFATVEELTAVIYAQAV
jgi:hypothetical protein